MSKFVAVLVVIAGMLMAGCAGDSASPIEVPASPTEASSPVEPTSMPTTVPTPTLDPTAVPTEVPTQVSTEEPTPTPEPTEVPMYVGLPAEEVAKLREQCLQDNPDSLCLPLPFGPADNAVISVVSEPWEDDWGMTVADGGGGHRFLSLEVPAETQLLSPLTGEVWIRGSIPNSGTRWLGLPGRTIEGVSSVRFGWEPIAYDLETLEGISPRNAPSVELVLVKREDCTEGGPDPFLYRGGDIFEESDLIVQGESREVVTGEPLAQTAKKMCLRIVVFELVYSSVVFPDGSTFGGQLPWGRTHLSDLLTTDAGSIVYVALP